MRPTVVVLKPSLSYGGIAAAFTAAGWRGGPTTLTPALLPGEPEVGVWRRDGTVARYYCNPVVWLRVLHVSGPAKLPALPALRPDDVHHLLASPKPHDQLLGVLSAAELKLANARPALGRLAKGSSPSVRAAAQHALDRLKLNE